MRHTLFFRAKTAKNTLKTSTNTTKQPVQTTLNTQTTPTNSQTANKQPGTKLTLVHKIAPTKEISKKICSKINFYNLLHISFSTSKQESQAKKLSSHNFFIKNTLFFKLT